MSSQVEEQLRRLVQRLAALREIDLAITASLDLRVTLSVVLDKVTSQLGVDAADMLLFSPQTHTLDYAAGRGFRTTALQHRRLSLGEGYAGEAADQRRTVIIPNLREASPEPTRASLVTEEGFVTYVAAPLVAKGLVKAVLELFHRTVLTPDEEWLDLLGAFTSQAAIGIDNAALFADLQQARDSLALAYDRTLEGWSQAMELRDQETEGHTQRVAHLTVRLGRALGLRQEELIHVRRGALLHDIGKMAIPDRILHKPGRLTEDEWQIMRVHPIHAYELLSPIEYLHPALDIPHYHHERWDGSGYPSGLKGEQIPIAARIFAVADVWDALIAARPYRPPWTPAKAREHIREQAGKLFDPRVVDAFLKLDLAEPAA